MKNLSNQIKWITSGLFSISVFVACSDAGDAVTSTEVESEFSIAGEVIQSSTRGPLSLKVLNSNLDSIDAFKTNWEGEFNHQIVSNDFDPKTEVFILEVINRDLSIIIEPTNFDSSKNNIISPFSHYLVEKSTDQNETLVELDLDSLQTKLYSRIFSEDFEYVFLVKSNYHNIVEALEEATTRTAAELNIDVSTLLNQSNSLLLNSTFQKYLAEYIAAHPDKITPYDLRRLDNDGVWVDKVVEKLITFQL